ncbi:MAG: bifunctional 4-hydroxy-2-oxoglutarate aldolase/2-dehydro-3-deoxy-phosphogluconate aldolase [Oscillospiraceae bacterium]|jgi:2-dehydro-3-deoxyphosphogluconate aldolase/(4S)-4-hydroxy-2-oxoglutarate aldolase|nr:bifunctional 4-hydroxy-2-oxoglutarate aldolase/2-dehydro-3-deoxy-phosphogluconate aldolase [Oscillospiraceae bacterium]
MEIKELILKDKVIVIVRRIYGDTLLRLAEAMCEGDVHLMELTFDQSNPDCITATGESITTLKARFGDVMRFGAGTVLTAEQVVAAKQAGCEYIISPNVSEAVIRCSKENGLVSIPGAMTATEILNAHDCGADFVKLFPAGYLGTSYVKDIRAPISHVKLLATGGIKEENFGDFLKAGCVGAGISGRLTDKTCIAEGNFAELSRRARAMRAIADEN